jgi:4-hydroxy-3-methylbut-2-enyl diphosphate reductase
MCFGVRDSLEMIAGIEAPQTVTIHGQLVHNEVVQRQLQSRGFAVVDEVERKKSVPATEAVLVTAHGISDRERKRLESAGKQILDTTCPLVKRVHLAARELHAHGYHVLVIGRRRHVEVEGITDDLEHFEVLESVDDVQAYPYPRLGIVCQTTSTEAYVAAIRDAVAARNPGAEIRFIDTVCQPTKEHQRALERLLDRVEAVVVVGGRNSNNTLQLVARARQRNKPAFHVQSASDLDPAWFKDLALVGLTAGTSTLSQTIDEVHRALVWIGVSSDEPRINGASATDPAGGIQPGDTRTSSLAEY